MRHLHSMVFSFLLAIGLISFQAFNLSAADVRYVYDELGRLIAVIDTAGQTAIYNYDAVGNLLSITTQSSSTVAILEFTPNSGPIGATVTIFGNGFSATPSQNTVKFNGVTATVTSSTVNQIVTTVPTGATTGLVSVTCPGGSASSSASFIVPTGPTVAGFLPGIGGIGSFISITGTNFSSNPAQNTVSFHQTNTSVLSSSPVSLNTKVPIGATSGKIKVITPIGQGTSAQDFFVPPTPLISAAVEYSDRIAVGQNKTVTLSINKVGLLIFDGNAGQQITLNITAVTFPTCFVTIYKPNGILLQSVSIGSAGANLGPITLPSVGTYTVLVAPIETINTIAGVGIGDGSIPTLAKLVNPGGTAIDSQGNIFIADSGNNLIRKIDTTGIISTVAGNGFRGSSGDGGQATAASLSNPRGIAVDGSGNIFIADRDNVRIRKVSTDGIIQTYAGTGNGGFGGDGGLATNAMISYPQDVALDNSGSLIIADTQNHRIRKVNSSGIITTIAGTGATAYNGDGIPATTANISDPWGVYIDSAGNIFIPSNTQHRIRKVDTSGNISTIAGTGTAGFSGDGGQATLAKLNSPTAVWLDSGGNLFISDKANQRIRKINTSGIISTFAGNGTSGFSGDGGTATSANMNNPEGVMKDSTGNLFIADAFNNRIRKVNTSNIISTFAGYGSGTFSGDGGPAASANLYSPIGALRDSSGNTIITDGSNHRIRKVNSSGIISTIAGTGVSGLSGDGGQATLAKISGPGGISVDSSGNFFFADKNNHRIRKITTAGIISTVAGTSVGFFGDGGSATSAQLRNPSAVAVDTTGNFYICDGGNFRIRKVSSGIITTVAGNGTAGYSGDGGLGTAAKINGCSGLAINSLGEIHFTDTNNHRIRKLNSSGIISTVAGTTTFGFSGDGGQATLAKLSGPLGLAFDQNNNYYISDSQNKRIRKVTSAGIINTIAGNGASGYAGDMLPPLSCSFYNPLNLWIDSQGNILIVDADRVRKIHTGGPGSLTISLTSP